MGDVCNMMSVREKEAERLAEILREVFALSQTNRPNHSKCPPAEDSIKLVDPQGAGGIQQTCAPHAKETNENGIEPEDQNCHR